MYSHLTPFPLAPPYLFIVPYLFPTPTHSPAFPLSLWYTTYAALPAIPPLTCLETLHLPPHLFFYSIFLVFPVIIFPFIRLSLMPAIFPFSPLKFSTSTPSVRSVSLLFSSPASYFPFIFLFLYTCLPYAHNLLLLLLSVLPILDSLLAPLRLPPLKPPSCSFFPPLKSSPFVLSPLCLQRSPSSHIFAEVFTLGLHPFPSLLPFKSPSLTFNSPAPSSPRIFLSLFVSPLCPQPPPFSPNSSLCLHPFVSLLPLKSPSPHPHHHLTSPCQTRATWTKPNHEPDKRLLITSWGGEGVRDGGEGRIEKRKGS